MGTEFEVVRDGSAYESYHHASLGDAINKRGELVLGDRTVQLKSVQLLMSDGTWGRLEKLG